MRNLRRRRPVSPLLLIPPWDIGVFQRPEVERAPPCNRQLVAGNPFLPWETRSPKTWGRVLLPWTVLAPSRGLPTAEKRQSISEQVVENHRKDPTIVTKGSESKRPEEARPTVGLAVGECRCYHHRYLTWWELPRRCLQGSTTLLSHNFCLSGSGVTWASSVKSSLVCEVHVGRRRAVCCLCRLPYHTYPVHCSSMNLPCPTRESIFLTHRDSDTERPNKYKTSSPRSSHTNSILLLSSSMVGMLSKVRWITSTLPVVKLSFRKTRQGTLFIGYAGSFSPSRKISAVILGPNDLQWNSSKKNGHSRYVVNGRFRYFGEY